jgi:hypothetical protein
MLLFEHKPWKDDRMLRNTISSKIAPNIGLLDSDFEEKDIAKVIRRHADFF